jgi:hypothetical protein
MVDSSFNVRGSEPGPHELPKGDFVDRPREQLGLVITPAQRSLVTIVYRQR